MPPILQVQRRASSKQRLRHLCHRVRVALTDGVPTGESDAGSRRPVSGNQSREEKRRRRDSQHSQGGTRNPCVRRRPKPRDIRHNTAAHAHTRAHVSRDTHTRTPSPRFPAGPWAPRHLPRRGGYGELKALEP